MLTQQQITERKGYVGASDAAAVCEIDPYRTSYDIWCEKTGRVENFGGNDATDAGDRLERVVIDWAADRLNASSIERSVFVPHPHVKFIAANLDAVLGINGVRVNVDAKSSGIVSPLRHDFWTDEEFPERFTVQLQHQMACDPTLDHAYLAALCPPKGLLIYRVERDQVLIDAIMEKIIDFWERCIVTDTPPDWSKPTLDVAKRLRRVPAKETQIDGETVRAWIEAIDVRKDAEKREQDLKAEIIASLGDAELGTYVGGLVTYYETHREGYVAKPTSYRVLRSKK
jgi:putative phage-type endonuclease